MTRIHLAAILALASCGAAARNGDDGAGGDAGSGDASRPARPDGGDVAPRCDPTAPFGAPEPVGALNTAAYEQTPTLSADERLILFGRMDDQLGAQMKVYLATRADRSEPFGTPMLVPSLDVANTSSVSPTVTADGLAVFVQKNGGTTWDIEVATRATTAAAFSSLANVYDTGSIDEYAPSVSPDGLAIYFEANMGGGSTDIYFATRANVSAAFGAPSPLPGVNDGARFDGAPLISPDGLRIYFLRDTGGTYRWFVATRSSTSASFGNVQVFDAFDAAFTPSWVSADDCVFYLHGPAVTGSPTVSDIYVATRPE